MILYFSRSHFSPSSSYLLHRWNSRTREPGCVNLWLSLSGAITTSHHRHVSLTNETLEQNGLSVLTCDSLFQAQSQVVVVMSPPQMELSDKRAKILLGLGATQLIIGILEVFFNIGANVMFAHVFHYTGAGYWCGAFVSHGFLHHSDVIMGTVASQISSLTIVYSTVYSGANQRKHQNGWANSREADDLRRHRAHYDVIICNGWVCRGKKHSDGKTNGEMNAFCNIIREIILERLAWGNVFKWRFVCQHRYQGQGQVTCKQQCLCDVIICPCPWYLHLAHTSPQMLSITMTS